MRLSEAVSMQEEALLRSLQESIRICSVEDTPQEDAPYGRGVRRCLDHALDTARSLGLSAVDLDHQVGWCEFGEGEEMIAVLGHLDVVPAGDGWSFDPFGGEIADGKIFGRGTMDDKGPTMAALYAMAALKESGLPLKRRVRLIFGTNEETGSYDIAYYKSHGGELPVMGITPDGEYPVINGEKGIINASFQAAFHQEGPLRLLTVSGGDAHNVVPSSAAAECSCAPELASELVQKLVPYNDRVRIRKTEQGLRIEALGVSAHGSTPQLGENAIGYLMKTMEQLPLAAELKRVIGFLAQRIGTESDGRSLGIAMSDSLSGALTMNLGTIQGDDSSLSVKLNYRYPVTKTYEDCAPVLIKAFEEAGFVMTDELHKAGIYVPEDSRLVRTLLDVYEEQTGLPAVPKCIGGGTYAKVMPNIVAFGPIFPGDEVREHKPDEFMEIDKLMKNAQILAEAIYRLAR